MKLKSLLIGCGVLVWLISVAVMKPPPIFAAPDCSAGFDPSIALTAKLPTGSLGLPGESITWLITVKNTGARPGTNVVVSDLLQHELRVDRAETSQGEVAISEQIVVFTIPVLDPGESIQMQINTTVLRSPANGVVINQAMLAATGPEGAITRKAIAQLFLPAAMPTSDYQAPAKAAEDLPGEGEPSALQIGLIAFGVVMIGAAIVWYRGRRRWQSLE